MNHVTRVNDILLAALRHYKASLNADGCPTLMDGSKPSQEEIGALCAAIAVNEVDLSRQPETFEMDFTITDGETEHEDGYSVVASSFDDAVAEAYRNCLSSVEWIGNFTLPAGQVPPGLVKTREREWAMVPIKGSSAAIRVGGSVLVIEVEDESYLITLLDSDHSETESITAPLV